MTEAYSRSLSKSKLVAFRQCPKRLWLEVHRPELREDSAATETIFRAGHQVGAIARQLYDPQKLGALIDLDLGDVDAALRETKKRLQENRPIFEAGFKAAGGLAFADVLLPLGQPGSSGEPAGWAMVEVKSSASVKSYHEDDVAIQCYVARASGLNLLRASVAHIDTSWTYERTGDYLGLLVEEDLTQMAFARTAEVTAWIAGAQFVATQDRPPEVEMGDQCVSPFPCGFAGHCGQNKPEPEFPLSWLPGRWSKGLQEFLSENLVDDLRDVPDYLLSYKQKRVRDATLTSEVYFDAEGARADLAPYPLPGYFLDFETIQFAVPRWLGTRPFQMIPFQFSCHRLDEHGNLSHEEFLDISGDDPRRRFAEALLLACEEPLPVFVYNAGFEGSRINELAAEYFDLRQELLELKSHLVDLCPVARNRYYHPSQQGSWSIKSLLPAIAPGVRYDDLDGVHDGAQAMDAYLEAIQWETHPERKTSIRRQLLDYCKLDTLAMVEVWKRFTAIQDECIIRTSFL